MSPTISRFTSKVIWGLGRRYGKYIPSCRKNLLFQAFAQLANCYLYYFENHFYEFSFNGEEYIIKKLTPPKGGVLLDVGGHHGNYAELLLSQCPRTQIHVFEMNPVNLKILQKKIGNQSNIKIHPIGLSSKEKNAAMVQYNQDGQISSLHNLGLSAAPNAPDHHIVSLKRGDQILAHEKIQDIYFMKIDTEGHDLEVLKGFEDALNQKRVHIIQFEYNETSIYARLFLKDFFDYLLSKKYKIGRIFPKSVEFTEYSTTFEDHRGSNWIACADTLPGKQFISSVSG